MAGGPLFRAMKNEPFYAAPWWRKILEEIKEKIVEVVRRLIPRERRKFTRRIPVDGNPAIPIEIPVIVAGNPFEIRDLQLPVLGNVAVPFQILEPIQGFPLHHMQELVSLTGDLSESVSSKLEILGASSSRFELQLSCRGEKDFTKMLWEILEDENGEE